MTKKKAKVTPTNATVKRNNYIDAAIMQPLAIDINYGLSQFFMYEGHLNLASEDTSILREIYERKIEEQTPYFLNSEEEFAPVAGIALSEAPPGSIAVVPMIGTMFAEDGLCTRGINHTCSAIARAADHPNIVGTMLRTNSGGGEVTAAQRLANQMKDSRKRKPILQFIDGVSASGAVFAGVESDYIMAGGETASTGSVGVVIQLDKYVVEYLKENVLSIYSNLSEDKHDFMKALLDGDFASIRRRHLDPIARQFQQNIQARMPKVKEEALTGFMYFAKDAKKMGLIDGIGTMQDAAARLIHLSKNRGRKNSANKALSSWKS